MPPVHVNVIVEAFATGTPVVAADIGGLGELVVEGVNGSKFQSGSSDQLAEVVSRLWQAPALRAKQRAANRERFEREYSPQAGLTSLQAVYREATLMKAT